MSTKESIATEDINKTYKGLIREDDQASWGRKKKRNVDLRILFPCLNEWIPDALFMDEITEIRNLDKTRANDIVLFLWRRRNILK